MLTPIDKINRRGNNIIQVVITRNCSLYNCSDCTQLLPFRQDVKEMSLECIEEALVGLQGWSGVAAVFGGCPNTHSHFPEVLSLWRKYIPDQRQRGLWTNDLLKYGAECKQTFWPNGRFNLNVHGSHEAAAKMRKWLPGIPIYGENGNIHHAAILADYRDYGYTEKQWVFMRERCTINQNWSSGIYQGSDGKPYAYFCEVAGSITGVLTDRHEDVGVPATPGWWKQPMEKFEHQVGACCDRGCGVALNM